jgi:predicted metal-dependent hydrolase
MKIAELHIKITKSSRKTVSIFIERDGSVSARVPETFTDKQIEDVVLSKQYQIHKHLAQWTQLNEKKSVREYVNGQSFLYHGRNYKLKIIDEDFNGLVFRGNCFYISKKQHDKAKKYFIEFYKIKLLEKINVIIKRYKDQLGVNPNEIKIMELQNRWASCSSKSNLNFHWKCAMAPIDVINYIVLHEMVHILHPDHTKHFWNELDKIMPQYQKHVDWLKMNGAGMDL